MVVLLLLYYFIFIIFFSKNIYSFYHVGTFEKKDYRDDACKFVFMLNSIVFFLYKNE